MEWTLEMIVVPVSDVDRAKDFYADQVGFHVYVDHRAGDDFRVVQLTPPGSKCSITVGKGISQVPPGSAQGMHLVVSDIDKARAELAERGVDVSEVQHFENGQLTPGPDPARSDYGSYCFFKDPDGNGWAVQEVKRAGTSA